MESLNRYKNLLIVFGTVVVVGVLAVTLTGGGDEPEDLASPSTTEQGTPSTTEPGTEGLIGPIECDRLLTLDEVYEALGALDDPELGAGSTGANRAEACRQTLSANEDLWVEISPGDTSDFAPGGEILGAVGVPVDGPWEDARLFGGLNPNAGGATGVIAVRQPTEFGVLHFRILMGRPDVDAQTTGQILIQLATAAFPRFYGVHIPAPVPEVVVLDVGDPPSTRTRSLGDLVLAGEGDGSWTRGEGLVGALELIAGDTSTFDSLGSDDFGDPDATIVIELARHYLEDSANDELREEIAELLDRLTLTTAELEGMASGPSALGLSAAVGGILFQVDQDPCEVFDRSPPCAEEIALAETAGVPSGKYRLFVANPAAEAWPIDHVFVATEAILASAAKYEALGAMPSTTVVLFPSGGDLYVDYRPDECLVYVDSFATQIPEEDFQQLLAREISFCLIGENFNAVIRVDPARSRWWSRGFANYLSGYVYPRVNFEHKTLPAELAAEELSTDLSNRSWTNWVFFEYLHSFLGASGNFGLVGSLPVGGDHLAALAGAPGMEELFHDFERALTDADVADLGPGLVPYEPMAWDLPLSGPVEADFTVPRFGVRRVRIVVPDGMYACFDTDQTTSSRSSWRPGAPGTSGSWEDTPPIVLEGEWTLVVTAVEPAATFSLHVSDVSENEDCDVDPDSGGPVGPPPPCGGCGPSRYYGPGT